MYLILLYNKILDSCFFKKDPIKPQTGWNEQFANNMGVRRSSQPLLNSLNPEKHTSTIHNYYRPSRPSVSEG
jgi:hypothetical protein